MTIITNILMILMTAMVGWQCYVLGKVVERGRLLDRVIAKRKSLTGGLDAPGVDVYLSTMEAFREAMDGDPMPPKELP